MNANFPRIDKFILNRVLLLLLTQIIFLTGCNKFSFPPVLPQPTDVSTPPGVENTAIPTIEGTPSSTVTPTGPQELTIWVPPQFDPDSGSISGNLLQNRLENFCEENPGVDIFVRVKASTGPSNLLESLTTTNAAAPSALPSLIALDRTNLETAALKGLIYPLDDLTTVIDDPDWFDYSRQLALIQGNTFGLPFAGDALLITYRPGKIGTVPVDWENILRRGQTLLFPAADPQALTTLTLYLSAGGEVEDSQNRPMLEPEVLSQVFTLYTDGAQQGVFPPWLSQYQTDGQVWQAYHDQEAHWMLTWSSYYLSELPVDTAAIPLPTLGSEDLTMASGWLWALSEPLPERQTLSADLAEYLIASDFLASWTPTIGYLPTRPTTLVDWTNQSMRSLISQIVLSAQIRPSNDLTNSLGPVLKESTLLIIERKSNPIQAAQSAHEQLYAPESE